MNKLIILCFSIVGCSLQAADSDLQRAFATVLKFSEDKRSLLDAKEETVIDVTQGNNRDVQIRGTSTCIKVLGNFGGWNAQAIIEDDKIHIAGQPELDHRNVLECFVETPFKQFLHIITQELKKQEEVVLLENHPGFEWEFYYEGSNKIVGERRKEESDIFNEYITSSANFSRSTFGRNSGLSGSSLSKSDFLP